MASSRLFCSLLVISLLLLAINASHSSFEQNNEIDDGHHGYNDQKVNVSLYYETLCPGCQNFIVNHLENLYKKKDLMAIINLQLVPYGNAIKEGSKDIVCQHGPHECYYNTIEACALDAWPLEKSFPFIYCVETHLQQYDEKIWVSCSKDLNLDPKIIQSCYKNGHGNQLILKNANETAGLKPPHQYVPWVTLNNKPLYDKIDTLISEICNAYKGHGKPKSCKGMVTRSTDKKESSKFAVCRAYDEDRMPV